MKKIIIIFLVLMIVPQTVLAQSLSYFETDIDTEWNKLDFKIVMIFEELPKEFSYPIFYPIKDFEASANFENYKCRLSEKDWGSEIHCDFSKISGRGKTLKFNYKSEELIEKIKDKKMVDFGIRIPFKAKKALVRTTLNKGLILMEENETSSLVPYTPRNGTKGSDGRHIYVYWVKENIPRGEDFDISLIYEKVGPTQQRDNTFLFLLTGSIFLIVLLIGLAMKGKEEKFELSILKEDERKIFELIRKYGGNCKQKRLVKETDYSKAKISRMVRNLKERDLIEVERLGRTNRIKIKKPEKKN